MTDAETAQMEIAEHRKAIDDYDVQIVKLLNERAEHSLAIRALKPIVNMGLYDPAREEQIFQRLEGFNQGPMQNENLREIYASILKVMKEIPA